MKKTFSIEAKIIIAAALALLTVATAVVLNQVFESSDENVKFVYNSSSKNIADGVNISEIFVENINKK